jgi:LemA protein
VSLEDRIERLAADGVISPEQAELLRRSARGGGDQAATNGEPRPRRLNPWLIAGPAILLVIAVLWFAAGTSGDPGPIQDVAETLNQPGGTGTMNRSTSAILAIALLLIVPILLWTWLYNGLVGKEETVFETWAQVESNLQRRADLIPALVESVSRYLKHESETLGAVTAERSAAATRIGKAIDALIRAGGETSDILRAEGPAIVEDEAALGRLLAAEGGYRRGIDEFMAVAEVYPDLRSSDQFLELQAQLEGTENRVNVARQRFNEAVSEFNGTMRMVPWSLVAGLGNFRRKGYFRADTEARDAPEVKFD